MHPVRVDLSGAPLPPIGDVRGTVRARVEGDSLKVFMGVNHDSDLKDSRPLNQGSPEKSLYSNITQPIYYSDF